MSNTDGIYGRDLACLINEDGVLDLTDTMQEVTGLDVLAQSLIRRHLTAKGSDISSPNDGIDVRQLIKNGLTQQELSVIAVTIQQELIRDQRVLPNTTVVATFNPQTNVMTLNETIQTAAGPFSLTLAVSSVTVEVLQNGAA